MLMWPCLVVDYISLFHTTKYIQTFYVHIYCELYRKTIAIFWSCIRLHYGNDFKDFHRRKKRKIAIDFFRFHQNCNEHGYEQTGSIHILHLHFHKGCKWIWFQPCLRHCRCLMKLVPVLVQHIAALPLFRLQFQNANNIKTIIRLCICGLVEYLCYLVCFAYCHK